MPKLKLTRAEVLQIMIVLVRSKKFDLEMEIFKMEKELQLLSK